MIGTAVTNYFAKKNPMKFDKFGSNYSTVLIMGISDFHGHTALVNKYIIKDVLGQPHLLV